MALWLCSHAIPSRAVPYALGKCSSFVSCFSRKKGSKNLSPQPLALLPARRPDHIVHVAPQVKMVAKFDRRNPLLREVLGSSKLWTAAEALFAAPQPRRSCVVLPVRKRRHRNEYVCIREPLQPELQPAASYLFLARSTSVHRRCKPPACMSRDAESCMHSSGAPDRAIASFLELPVVWCCR